MPNEAKREALANADAHLANAGLVTYSDLLALLQECRSLGLNFDIGNAYIRRAYIDKQDALRARIAAAIGAAKS